MHAHVFPQDRKTVLYFFLIQQRDEYFVFTLIRGLCDVTRTIRISERDRVWYQRYGGGGQWRIFTPSFWLQKTSWPQAFENGLPFYSELFCKADECFFFFLFCTRNNSTEAHGVLLSSTKYFNIYIRIFFFSNPNHRDVMNEYNTLLHVYIITNKLVNSILLLAFMYCARCTNVFFFSQNNPQEQIYY